MLHLTLAGSKQRDLGFIQLALNLQSSIYGKLNVQSTKATCMAQVNLVHVAQACLARTYNIETIWIISIKPFLKVFITCLASRRYLGASFSQCSIQQAPLSSLWAGSTLQAISHCPLPVLYGSPELLYGTLVHLLVGPECSIRKSMHWSWLLAVRNESMTLPYGHRCRW